MIEYNATHSWTFWQTNEETGQPEPAILIEQFDDCIGLFSDGNRININYDSLDELLKKLRTIKKEHDSK